MKYKLGYTYLVRRYGVISKITIYDITKKCYRIKFEYLANPIYEVITEFDENYECIECLDYEEQPTTTKDC